MCNNMFMCVHASTCMYQWRVHVLAHKDVGHCFVYEVMFKPLIFVQVYMSMCHFKMFVTVGQSLYCVYVHV